MLFSLQISPKSLCTVGNSTEAGVYELSLNDANYHLQVAAREMVLLVDRMLVHASIPKQPPKWTSRI